MNRWAALAPLVLLAALVVVGVVRLTDDDPAPKTFASPERMAPDVSAPGLSGGDVRMSAFGGRPVLVNFWATWCTPCKAEHPLLLAMKAEGAEILGVLHKDQPDLARRLLVEDGDPFEAVALDPTGDISMAFGISGVPETFLINAEGRIVKSLRGPLDPGKAEEFLEAWRREGGRSAP